MNVPRWIEYPVYVAIIFAGFVFSQWYDARKEDGLVSRCEDQLWVMTRAEADVSQFCNWLVREYDVHSKD